MKENLRKKRIFFSFLTLLLFVIEVIIALYVRDKFIRPYVGDIIVTVLIYCFIRIFYPRGHKWLPLGVFIFACCIEFLQYLNFVEIIGLADNIYARTIIGTSFSWVDIICYGIGCIFCSFFQLGEFKLFQEK